MPIDIQIMKFYLWEQFFFKNKILKAQHTREFRKASSSIQQKASRASEQTKKEISDCTFTIFDLETTGFFPEIGDEILSIGAVKVENETVKYNETFYTVVEPINKVSNFTKELTGLTQFDLNNGQFLPAAIDSFLEFSKDTILVAHPASFDINFIKQVSKHWGLPDFSPNYIDSLGVANHLFASKSNYLDRLIDRYNVLQRDRHHALNDAVMTAEVFVHLLDECISRSITSVEELRNMGTTDF